MNLISRSVSSKLLGMEIKTRLVKAYEPDNNEEVSVRFTDFRNIKDEYLQRVTYIIHGIYPRE